MKFFTPYWIGVLLLPIALLPEEGAYTPKEPIAYLEAAREKIHSGEVPDILKGIELLSHQRSKMAIRDLTEVLAGDENFPGSPVNDPSVKFFSAQALAKMEDPTPIPDLIAQYKKNQESILEDPKSKRKAKDGVSTASSKTSPYLYATDDISIVLAVGEILRTLGILKHTAESEEVIKSALSHKNSYIRASSADAMYYSQRKEYLPLLRDALANEKDELTKVSLHASIGGIERLPNSTFYALGEALQKSNPEIRKKASEGLIRMDLTLAGPFYEKAMATENKVWLYESLKSDYKRLMSFRHPQ